MSKDNSGSAFPVQVSKHDFGAPGMTLRDYFAGQAISNGAGMSSPDESAEWAYRVADAMLEARK